MYLLAVAEPIACKEASLIDASSGTCPPPSTLSKLRDIERWQLAIPTLAPRHSTAQNGPCALGGPLRSAPCARTCRVTFYTTSSRYPRSLGEPLPQAPDCTSGPGRLLDAPVSSMLTVCTGHLVAPGAWARSGHPSAPAPCLGARRHRAVAMLARIAGKPRIVRGRRRVRDRHEAMAREKDGGGRDG